MKNSSGFLVGVLAVAALGLFAGEERIPATWFGQNLEHTRRMMTGGLSAELVENRKFAGKPSPTGVARKWRAVGARGVYDLLMAGYTRHNGGRPIARRLNEISSQKITAIVTNGWSGIAQDGLALRKGMDYALTLTVRGCFAGERVSGRARLLSQDGLMVYAETPFTCTGTAWTPHAFSFRAPGDMDATLAIEVCGPASLVVGTASVLPADNFHGMRRDVIACLKEIGTSIVRWPGGNFAGDYRWRDGLLPRDQRAPLQSVTEFETQTYTGGYDENDIGTDEILALCEELKAEPYFTLNAYWDTPEGSADWLRHCKGRVRRWSLGNELGYAHMEGPQTPDAYAQLAGVHARALLAVDPNLLLTSSGPFPNPRQCERWIAGSVRPLLPMARSVSAHTYVNCSYDCSTPQRIQESLDVAMARTEQLHGWIRDMAAHLPPEVTISYDEWNFWYCWYREDGGLQGVWAMDALQRLLANGRAFRLDCACYFQAINEGAMVVSPRTVRLTSIGEAFRLAKGHVGGVPTALAGLPKHGFATRRENGRIYATLCNPSVSERLVVTLPGIAQGEGTLLTVADPYPGTRYQRAALPFAKAEGGVRIELPPLALAAFTAVGVKE